MIVTKEVFYDFSFVSKTYNKFIEPKRSIALHYVPYYRIFSDFYHWLWFDFCFFSQSCTKSTCKQYYRNTQFIPLWYVISGLNCLDANIFGYRLA